MTNNVHLTLTKKMTANDTALQPLPHAGELLLSCAVFIAQHWHLIFFHILYYATAGGSCDASGDISSCEWHMPLSCWISVACSVVHDLYILMSALQ